MLLQLASVPSYRGMFTTLLFHPPIDQKQCEDTSTSFRILRAKEPLNHCSALLILIVGICAYDVVLQSHQVTLPLERPARTRLLFLSRS